MDLRRRKAITRKEVIKSLGRIVILGQQPGGGTLVPDLKTGTQFIADLPIYKDNVELRRAYDVLTEACNAIERVDQAANNKNIPSEIGKVTIDVIKTILKNLPPWCDHDALCSCLENTEYGEDPIVKEFIRLNKKTSEEPVLGDSFKDETQGPYSTAVIEAWKAAALRGGDPEVKRGAKDKEPEVKRTIKDKDSGTQAARIFSKLVTKLSTFTGIICSGEDEIKELNKLPPNPVNTFILGLMHNQLAEYYAERKYFAEAEVHFKEAEKLFKNLAQKQDHPLANFALQQYYKSGRVGVPKDKKLAKLYSEKLANGVDGNFEFFLEENENKFRQILDCVYGKDKLPEFTKSKIEVIRLLVEHLECEPPNNRMHAFAPYRKDPNVKRSYDALAEAYAIVSTPFLDDYELNNILSIEDILTIIKTPPPWCSTELICQILYGTEYSKDPRVRERIDSIIRPDHIAGYVRKIPNIKKKIIWAPEPEVKAKGDKPKEKMEMGGRLYPTSMGSPPETGINWHEVEWCNKRELIHHILLDNGIAARYQSDVEYHKKEEELVFAKDLLDPDIPILVKDYYEGLLRTVPIVEIYDSANTMVGMGEKVVEEKVAKLFIKDLEVYQFANIRNLYQWQCEASGYPFNKDLSEEEKFLLGLRLIIVNAKWEVGVFGGEEIGGKTYPKGAGDILRVITKAFNEKEEALKKGKTIDFVAKINAISQIIEDRPKLFSFLNARQSSTHKRYNQIQAQITHFINTTPKVEVQAKDSKDLRRPSS